MYKIVLEVDPEFGVTTTLKISKWHRGKVKPYQFYLDLRHDIQQFKENVDSKIKINRNETNVP